LDDTTLKLNQISLVVKDSSVDNNFCEQPYTNERLKSLTAGGEFCQNYCWQ